MGIVAGYLGAAPSLLWALSALDADLRADARRRRRSGCTRWCSRSRRSGSRTTCSPRCRTCAADARRRIDGAAGCPPRAAVPRPPPSSHGPTRMNFGLIIVGDEILSGKRADKHLPKVIELLAARGLALSWARYVGDDRERHHRRRCATPSPAATSCSRCGGIGATPDDHTRQCAAAALGRAARAAPRGARADRASACATSRAEQRRRLRARPRRTTCTGSTWASSPRAREIIPNPYNKIAGFAVRRRGVRVLRAGLSGDGVADDRMGARHRTSPPARRAAPQRAAR